MNGFKNFIMKGNLVELATAFIMATAFAAVVNSLVAVIMSIIPTDNVSFDAWTPGGYPLGAFLTALITFVIIAAVVYFFIVTPYTKAQEKWFPKQEEGTPADIALLEEIRDLLKVQRQA